MRNVLIGCVVAGAVIGAFAIGMVIQDSEPDGPAEEAGAALDDAVRELGGALEDAAN